MEFYLGVKFMKKLIVAGILATFTLFAGCSNTTGTQKNEVYNLSEVEEEENIKPQVNINDFVITGQLQEPDSIGTVYYKATLTNNSIYSVKFADFKYHMTKDGVEENTYLTFLDTISAGRTSSVSECFGSDDMELISITLTLVNTEGKNIYVEYDAKLNEIEIW